MTQSNKIQEVINFFKPYWTETPDDLIAGAIQNAIKRVPNNNLYIPDPETTIICPDYAGPIWKHKVLTGVVYDNSLFGVNMISNPDYPDLCTYTQTRKPWNKPVGDYMNFSLNGKLRSASLTESFPTKQDLLHLLSVLNLKQIEMIVGWAMNYAKQTQFEDAYNGNHNHGDVSMILNAAREVLEQKYPKEKITAIVKKETKETICRGCMKKCVLSAEYQLSRSGTHYYAVTVNGEVIHLDIHGKRLKEEVDLMISGKDATIATARKIVKKCPYYKKESVPPCDGCDKHCKIDTKQASPLDTIEVLKQEISAGNGRLSSDTPPYYIPTLNGAALNTHIQGEQLKTKITAEPTKEKAIAKAYEAVKECPCYKKYFEMKGMLFDGQVHRAQTEM